jgi:hypothetical protein
MRVADVVLLLRTDPERREPKDVVEMLVKVVLAGSLA